MRICGYVAVAGLLSHQQGLCAHTLPNSGVVVPRRAQPNPDSSGNFPTAPIGVSCFRVAFLPMSRVDLDAIVSALA